MDQAATLTREQRIAQAQAQGGYWSELRTELLKELWLDGLSASQIAKQLRHLTRNAVIGKLHRLGLSERGTPAAPKAPRPEKPSAPGRVKPALRLAGHGAVFEEPTPRPPLEKVVFREGAPDAGLRITDPGFGGCRWPLGGEGADIRHCCKRRPEGAAYCNDHARIAYQAAQPGKKKASGNELARSLRRYI